MFIRSLTIATLLVSAGPLLAADSDSPLNQDRGKARPLIVIAPSSVDPTLVSLQNALKEPANQKAFTERDMVLYTVINTMGKRNGKDLDAQSTMALIRELKLGASTGTKVILVGKDGEKQLEQLGPIGVKDLFTKVDQLPAEEKAASAPAVAAPVPEAKPGAEKTGKPAKGAPKTLDD
ncbi:tyrosyl-trna synthetase [Pseudomonas sp. S25]|uniref:Tyrosyl-trna synthetase n=1 Tax=Pseudomonas maioricensis TaxID=1766623 RepID=A0ABS9ZQK6_9PSED|nr:DUF4174 domain-containing protein [Pseudomonas sp. S25]MCI8212846.1 tyrosyl-trna synthetase [Pseudomonas sp. S25]